MKFANLKHKVLFYFQQSVYSKSYSGTFIYVVLREEFWSATEIWSRLLMVCCLTTTHFKVTGSEQGSDTVGPPQTEWRHLSPQGKYQYMKGQHCVPHFYNQTSLPLLSAIIWFFWFPQLDISTSINGFMSFPSLTHFYVLLKHCDVVFWGGHLLSEGCHHVWLLGVIWNDGMEDLLCFLTVCGHNAGLLSQSPGSWLQF